MFLNPGSIRWLFVIAVGLLLSVAVYGFAASNTVPASSAGEGSGTVSGFTVTNVHYNLNATTPSNIDSVTFTISPAVPGGGSVKVKLVTTGDWYGCTVTGGTNVSCTTTSPQATAQTTDTLDVVAAQ